MNRRPNVDTLAVVALLGIFLCTSAALLLFGLQVYRQTQQGMEDTFQSNTPLAYLASKARQHDGVRLSAFTDGTPALRMEAMYAGELYTTWIYYREGALYELFTPADIELAPEGGEKLIDTQPLTFTRVGDMVRVAFSEEGAVPGQLLLSFTREGDMEQEAFSYQGQALSGLLLSPRTPAWEVGP